LKISSPPFSFYWLPVEPIDYSSISTRMSISGMQISLNASKMSEIIDLKPVVKVQEMQSEIVQKYLNLLEKWKKESWVIFWESFIYKIILKYLL
jgi:hypothetical protein